MSAVILIPAYEPKEELLSLVNELIAKQFKKIIIVNDGSKSKDSLEILLAVKNVSADVCVLDNQVNQGKGAALKKGFQYFLASCKGSFDTVITVDADGQHTIDDIIKLNEACQKKTSCGMTIGVRQFKDAPLRSKFGNLLTRWIFNKSFNSNLQDTQTGLRAISRDLVEMLLCMKSNRYEYETECLIFCIQEKIKINQVPIKTVYINENESSHFRPAIDSLKIYFVLLRYALSSIASFLIDVLIFVVVYKLSHSIFLSVVVARIISSCINFSLNKYGVYKSKSKARIKKEVTHYFTLVLIVMITNYLLIHLVHFYFPKWPILAIKITVDLLLSVLNFYIQRSFIFFDKNKSLV